MRIQPKINQRLSTPPKPAPPVKKEEDASPFGILDSLNDLVVAAKFISLGQVYKTLGSRKAKSNAENPPLANSPTVKLEQPFVMVPGWTTTREAFDPMAEKLLEGDRNGGKLYFIQNGEFFVDRECSHSVDRAEVQSADAKVFEVVFSDVRLEPSRSHKELSTNFAAIKQMTGHERLDVNAYSMGGLAVRNYLDNGGEDIDQLMILGTGNRGSQFAGWAHHMLVRDIKWAVSMAGLLPADIAPLGELSPEEHNESLRALNSRWAEQKSHVNEVVFVGGRGTPTGDDGWNPVTAGDGLVAVKKLAPEGETPIVMDGQHHSHLNNSAETYDVMRNYFGWQTD